MTRVGTIAELWRYPVKSMGGERIDVARLDRKGLVGDRLWALRDTASGEITGGKRIPGIMGLDARYRSEPDGGGIPAVDVTLPDGARVASDDANVHGRLTEFLGRAVTLEALRPASDAAHFRGAKGEEAMGLRQSMGVGSD
ncbi:MAG: MOSC N-terminal beta barrel domain-containing protein, partial [Myxococcales bacterium]|nr:MOSC N-terminal beta barrel domain-containing protein [Myxococcales bacterium]